MGKKSFLRLKVGLYMYKWFDYDFDLYIRGRKIFELFQIKKEDMFLEKKINYKGWSSDMRVNEKDKNYMFLWKRRSP